MNYAPLEILVRNWPIKLLALLLALGFWLFVVGQERAEVTLRVPLALVDRPANMVIVEQSAKAIEIRLSGTRALIERLGAKNLTLNLKLTGKGPGQHNFYIKPTQFPLPRGVSLVAISPSAVTIKLDKRVTKRLRVPLALKNKPPNSFLVGEPPSYCTVDVAGPQDVLAKLRPVQPPVAIDLSRAGEGPNRYRLVAGSFRLPSRVTVTRIRPDRITVRLEALVRRRLVVRLSAEAKLMTLPGFAVNRVEFRPDTVLAHGPRSALRDRRRVFTRPVTEMGLWKDVVFVVPLEIIDPRVTVEPKLVELSLTVGPAVPKRFPGLAAWPFDADVERYLPH